MVLWVENEGMDPPNLLSLPQAQTHGCPWEHDGRLALVPKDKKHKEVGEGEGESVEGEDEGEDESVEGEGVEGEGEEVDACVPGETEKVGRGGMACSVLLGQTEAEEELPCD